MNKVVIVVPLYKNKLNELEQISLHQMLRILKKHPKCFLIPENLDVSNIEKDSTCKFMSCPREWFGSVDAYSKLMLTSKFYKMFLKYEYILIHQLDAFVYRDELDFFCDQGVDYIGAPWFRSSSMFKYSKVYVGNGGLCLRHVAHTIRLLEINKNIVEEFIQEKPKSIGEDVLFSYFGSKKEFGYKLAPIKLAKEFSLECDFQKAYSYFGERLPFGCHHWWNADYEIWREYVKKQGYALKKCYVYTKSGQSKKTRIKDIARYLLDRIVRSGNKDKMKSISSNCFWGKDRIIVWGKGVIGERCMKLLNWLEFPVWRVVDNKAGTDELFFDVLVSRPNAKILQEDAFIIIATTRYYDEISRYLRNENRKENIDFRGLEEIEIQIVSQYYKDIRNSMMGCVD